MGGKYEAAEGNYLKEAISDFGGENDLDTKFTSKLQMLQRGFCGVIIPCCFVVESDVQIKL